MASNTYSTLSSGDTAAACRSHVTAGGRHRRRPSSHGTPAASFSGGASVDTSAAASFSSTAPSYTSSHTAADADSSSDNDDAADPFSDDAAAAYARRIRRHLRRHLGEAFAVELIADGADGMTRLDTLQSDTRSRF